ncbi:SDR family NAD(P)-dependent oxidoreductase [Paraburkholderia fungorum]|uniref:SDR family NAD(P)-dependent oxidoreductase n=1 Tax=Paraburkholderia fungorum TaxID=134537 RepID=UPI0038BA59A9
MNLSNKRVLITEGASGIGLATAHALCTKGATIFITRRRAHALKAALAQLRATEAKAGSIAADIATDEGRPATLSAALSSLGGLDILINNAGGVRAG